jgi:hypothetical protein
MSSLALQITPTLSGSDTQGLVADQGYTFNQAGQTFNEVGVMFGGLYQNQLDFPVFTTIAPLADTPRISGNADTEATLTDQGYTFNQAGQTFNEVGVMFGGISGYQTADMPIFATIQKDAPRIVNYADIYTPFVPPPTTDSGTLIGILGLTYP